MVISYIKLGCFLTISLTSIGLFHQFVVFDDFISKAAKSLIEFTLLLVAINEIFKKRSHESWILIFTISLYLLIRILLTLYSGNQFDPTTFKLPFYVLFFVIIYTPNLKNHKLNTRSIKIIDIFVLLLCLSYIVEVFFNFDATKKRSYFITENNFELIFLVSILLIQKRHSLITVVATYIAVFLSLSRSAVASLIGAEMFSKRLTKSVRLIVGVCGTMLVVAVFVARLGDSGISGIDRLQFAFVFEKVMSQATISEILFGSVSAISADLCEPISFYKTFMYEDGSCRSAILHSFLLRGIYDYGVLGTIVMIALLYTSLNNINHLIYVKSFFAIGFLSSLSISGFINSFFVLMPLLIRLLSTRK